GSQSGAPPHYVQNSSSSTNFVLFLSSPPPPRPPLFPYTTLFRSPAALLDLVQPPVARVVVVPEFAQIAFVQHPESGGRTRSVRTDRKSTRLNSSHLGISYAVFGFKKTIRYPSV